MGLSGGVIQRSLCAMGIGGGSTAAMLFFL
jgi:hypothetical protein